MRLFSFFKKSKQDSDIKSQIMPIKAVPTQHVLTSEEIKIKTEKDLAKLTSFEDKIKKGRKQLDKTSENHISTERPEEKRAREALSIKNPFRGV